MEAGKPLSYPTGENKYIYYCMATVIGCSSIINVKVKIHEYVIALTITSKASYQDLFCCGLI